MDIPWFDLVLVFTFLGTAVWMRIRAARRWKRVGGEAGLGPEVRQAVGAQRAAGDFTFIALLVVLGRVLSGVG